MPSIGRPSSLVVGNSAPHWAYWRFLDASRVYTPEQQSFGLNAAVVASISGNQIYAFPFFVGTNCKFNSFVYEINGGIGTTNYRFGIYRNRSVKSPYPTTLLWDSGVQAIASNGQKTIPGINKQAIGSSLYWIALFSDGGGSRVFILMTVSAAGWPTVAGIDPADPNNGAFCGYRAALAFAALPATYPAGATRSTMTTVAPNVCPAFGVTLSPF